MQLQLQYNSHNSPPVFSEDSELAGCLRENPLDVHQRHDHTILLQLGRLEDVRVKLQHLVRRQRINSPAAVCMYKSNAVKG